MTRYVLTVDLKDDPAAIAAYREFHQRVWPEVLRSLQHAGIRAMEIYILERRLVMIAETDGRDIRDAFAMHRRSEPRVIEWERMMKGLQAAPPGAAPGETWTPMTPVFRFDATKGQPAADPARPS